jgi:hypothetical protein
MAAHFPGLVQVLIKWVIKLVKSGQTVTPSETLMSCKCSPHVAKMSTFAYNWLNSVIIKNTLTLNSTHHIFNLRYTQVFIFIIIVLLKRVEKGCLDQILFSVIFLSYRRKQFYWIKNLRSTRKQRRFSSN